MKLEAAKAVCLTTDGWTSINNVSYIAITAHYILTSDQNTVLTSSMIGCIEYNDRHTSTNLAEFLKTIMAEWSLNYKTTAIASDNAANISAAIRLTDCRHIPCFAHTINLCVQGL